MMKTFLKALVFAVLCFACAIVFYLAAFLIRRYLGHIALIAIIAIIVIAYTTWVVCKKIKATTINKNWKPKEFRTGLINPATGKEWILSSYYEDKNGNRHFTHEEAMKIWDSVPGWGPCTEEFHKALRALVWDKETDGWRENVNGSGLNGLGYMICELMYEFGGDGFYRSSRLYDVGRSGHSLALAFSDYDAHHLNFNPTFIYLSNCDLREDAFQVRCLREE